MLEKTVYCYCDFSVSDDAISNEVIDLLHAVNKEFGFKNKFIRQSPSDDKGWTGNILKAMEGLSSEDYFFIWFDDLLVEQKTLIQAVSKGLVNVGDYAYIRVTGRPPPIGEALADNYRVILGRESYQCSLVGTLWSIGYFKMLVGCSDSPWDIERKKHNRPAIGSTSRLFIRNTKIKGKDNIFHHPQPTFSCENILSSTPWFLKRLLRETLCRFPRIYHWLYSK